MDSVFIPCQDLAFKCKVWCDNQNNYNLRDQKKVLLKLVYGFDAPWNLDYHFESLHFQFIHKIYAWNGDFYS